MNKEEFLNLYQELIVEKHKASEAMMTAKREYDRLKNKVYSEIEKDRRIHKFDEGVQLGKMEVLSKVIDYLCEFIEVKGDE